MRKMKVNLNKVCQQIEGQRCPVHGKHTTTRVSFRRIIIKTCCDNFHRFLERMKDEALGPEFKRFDFE